MRFLFFFLLFLFLSYTLPPPPLNHNNFHHGKNREHTSSLDFPASKGVTYSLNAKITEIYMTDKIIELADHSSSTRHVTVAGVLAGLEERKDTLQKIFVIGVLPGNSDRPRLVAWQGGMSDIEALSFLEIAKGCILEKLSYTHGDKK